MAAGGVSSACLSRSTNTSATLVWIIIRGNENLPTAIGGFTLPATARLVQKRIIAWLYRPLQWVTLVDLPNATGLFFAHVLQASSANLNFLEGCYHGCTPYAAPFPVLLLSTGTEDYFSLADYFDGGLFHFDHAGLIHFTINSSLVRLSAYRLHELDPVMFAEGFRLVWRVGDVVNRNGFKCIVEQGGGVVGNPQVMEITSYAWTHMWPVKSERAGATE